MEKASETRGPASWAGPRLGVQAPACWVAQSRTHALSGPGPFPGAAQDMAPSLRPSASPLRAHTSHLQKQLGGKAEGSKDQGPRARPGGGGSPGPRGAAGTATHSGLSDLHIHTDRHTVIYTETRTPSHTHRHTHRIPHTHSHTQTHTETDTDSQSRIQTRTHTHIYTDTCTEYHTHSYT